MAGEWITKANWEALNKRWVEMQERIAALEREKAELGERLADARVALGKEIAHSKRLHEDDERYETCHAARQDRDRLEGERDEALRSLGKAVKADAEHLELQQENDLLEKDVGYRVAERDKLQQEVERLLGLIGKASDQLGVATAETPAPIGYAQGYLRQAPAADRDPEQP